ncbi:MAG: hypothetical protein KAJ07_09815 [Planctomycetes bacterium]|nr:hypothetical protein [Planctomycetota bacterium]
MKNYLIVLTFAAMSFCLICSGCQPENVVEDKPTTAQPSVKPKAATVVAAPAPARSSRTRRGGLYGDWQVKVDSNGRQWESILSFSRDAEGNQVGQWISFWGISELKEVTYEESKLSFAQVRRNREGQASTSKFTGTIKNGKLSGILSGDRGESKLTGERSARFSRAVGIWEMKLKMGEREFESTLVVTADKEGKLAGEWKSRQGEHQVSDVNYERGKLSFKRNSKMGDRQWESAFEGTVQRGTFSGVIKSDTGEITVAGKRIGESLIGTWDLEVTSERGSRKQRLKVNSDMSGLYGAIALEKVELEGDKVSFKVAMEFGERKFEMSFEGKLDGAKLTGEVTTSRGSQKVTGTKVTRRRRTRSTR